MAGNDLRTLMAEMPKSARDFANYKTAIENLSKKTVSEYLLDLRTFFRYLKAQKEGLSLTEGFEEIDITSIDISFIRDISTADIYEFLMYAGDVRGNAWSAKARKLSAIKAYFKYMTTKSHILEDNPAREIDSPKRRQSLPKHLNLNESERLLSAVASSPDVKNRARDYAIVTLFLNCGMRLSELVGINISDIDSSFRSLKVTGKGSKERIIYLNEACRDALITYLEEKKPEDRVGQKPLFSSNRSPRISPKTVQALVYKYLNMADLEYKGFSTHKLRHTAATLMYQSGQVDVRVLKDILGHEQLNTTQIYTHISDKSMESAMNANPLSKIKNDK